MKCLVTGGTGFIGSNLAIALIEQGHEVILTGHTAEQKIPGFKGKILYPSFIGIDWDAIGHVDVLFHQAAIADTTVLDLNEQIRANVESTKALFKYVVDHGCKHIVYASSTAVYGNEPAPYIESKTPHVPLNQYGISKMYQDEFTMAFAKQHPDVTIVGLRYCNVYGPREAHKGKMANIIYQFAQQMLTGNPRCFKSGEKKRDHIYIKDVVRANLLAAKATESCIVNCGAGVAVTFNEIIRILNKLMGTNRTPEYIDNPHAARFQVHTECDMNLAKQKIGFVPEYSIEAGLQDYYNSGFLVPKK